MEQKRNRRMTAALAAALVAVAVLSILLYRTADRLKRADSAMAGMLYNSLIYIDDVFSQPNGSFGSLETYEERLDWAERIYPPLHNAHFCISNTAAYSGYLDRDHGDDSYDADRAIDNLYPARSFFRKGDSYVSFARKSRGDMDELAPQLADFCAILEQMDASAPGHPNISDLYAAMEQFHEENGYYVFDVKPPTAN